MINKENSNKFIPLIIIGSPRSGTNALRDSLTSIVDFETWPCDEINGIWRYKNISIGYDNLSKQNINSHSSNYIHNQFRKQWELSGRPKYLVEKTTANSLRPEFVYSIFPNAKYIFIARDGSEVVKSATKRWNGEFEYDLLEYWIQKIKYTPIADIPYYFFDIGSRRIKNMINHESMTHWGPNHPTLDLFRNSSTTEDLSALQWSLCLISSWYFFRSIPRRNVIFITYDSYLAHPEKFVKKLSSLLGEEIDTEENISSFKKNILLKERESIEYFPSNAIIKKYYESATKIYRQIRILSNF